MFSCLLLLATICLPAQKMIADSATDLPLATLQLNADQKTALKKLIQEYQLEDGKRRSELRHRMFILLNVQQQTMVRKWWRRQLKHSMNRR